MTLIKIANRNQVTLPNSLCNALSIAPGSVLDGTVRKSRLILSKSIEGASPDYKIRLRDRYQLTLPSAFCKEEWVSSSHMLEVEIEGTTLCLTPKAVIEAPSSKKIKQAVSKPLLKENFQPLGLSDLARRSSRRRRRGH